MATTEAALGGGGTRHVSDKKTLSIHDLRSLMMEVSDDNEHTLDDDAMAASTRRVLQKSASDVHSGSLGRKKMARSPLAKQMSCNGLNRTSSMSLSSWEYLKQHDALPVNTTLSRRVEKKLSKMCHRALELLETLEQPVSSNIDMSQEPALPSSAIRFSKALVFFWHRKAGFLGSYTWGYGFVISSIAPGLWSAPVFIKDRYMSLGLTVGLSASDAVFAIPDNTGVIPFIRTSYHCNGDFEISSGVTPYDTHQDGPSYIRTSVVKRSHGDVIDSSSKIKKYEVDTSMIVDMSVKCGVESVDDSLNTALYMDTNLSPRDILDGAVQIPTQLYPLYEYLRSRIENKGHMERRTTHLFEKERVKNVNKINRSSVSSSSSRDLQRWKSTQSLDSGVHDTWRSSDPGEDSHGTSCLFGDDALLEIDLGDP
ncbi:SH3 domain-containing protein [Picochlorum sp. SENEW3]|nr:SH3 domain-containing protein [Picochlorum sp. SENEW3]